MKQQEALRLALKTKPHEPRRKSLVVAIGFCGNGKQLISQNGTDIKQNGDIHAEARLIKRAMKLHTHVNAMHVFRFLRDGSMVCAKPCSKCLIKLLKRDINVWYSTNEGVMEKLK